MSRSFFHHRWVMQSLPWHYITFVTGMLPICMKNFLFFSYKINRATTMLMSIIKYILIASADLLRNFNQTFTHTYILTSSAGWSLVPMTPGMLCLKGLGLVGLVWEGHIVEHEAQPFWLLVCWDLCVVMSVWGFGLVVTIYLHFLCSYNVFQEHIWISVHILVFSGVIASMTSDSIPYIHVLAIIYICTCTYMYIQVVINLQPMQLYNRHFWQCSTNLSHQPIQ